MVALTCSRSEHKIQALFLFISRVRRLVRLVNTTYSHYFTLFHGYVEIFEQWTQNTAIISFTPERAVNTKYSHYVVPYFIGTSSCACIEHKIQPRFDILLLIHIPNHAGNAKYSYHFTLLHTPSLEWTQHTAGISLYFLDTCTWACKKHKM